MPVKRNLAAYGVSHTPQAAASFRDTEPGTAAQNIKTVVQLYTVAAVLFTGCGDTLCETRMKRTGLQ